MYFYCLDVYSCAGFHLPRRLPLTSVSEGPFHESIFAAISLSVAASVAIYGTSHLSESPEEASLRVCVSASYK